VCAEDALEVGIAGRCRVFDVEVPAGNGNAGRQKEIERHSEQRDERGVVRHDDILSNLHESPLDTAS
jgi:hypothetical protein